MSKVLIVGCGDIGTPLGLQLIAEGHQVWGLRRSAQLPAPIQTINADVTHPESLAVLTGLAFDYVVVTLTPAGFNDQAYQSIFVEGLGNLLAALSCREQLRRVLFVSSTSVYGQGDGQWVDEKSATEPKGFSGKRLLEAEKVLVENGLNATVVRFAGIYGPGRRRLIEQVKAGQGCDPSPPLFTNRIHRDDCVGFLAHLIELDQQGKALDSCYIGVDSEPVPMWELKCWLAQQMGIDPATLSKGAETRRASKRCSNRRMLATGYQLRFPGFQQGYGALLTESL